jgi:MbtH protein
MTENSTEDGTVRYLVVVNDEEQYSIWPDGRALPTGWRSVGEPADRDQCLDRITELWTDMRPASLREAR